MKYSCQAYIGIYYVSKQHLDHLCHGNSSIHGTSRRKRLNGKCINCLFVMRRLHPPKIELNPVCVQFCRLDLILIMVCEYDSFFLLNWRVQSSRKDFGSRLGNGTDFRFQVGTQPL